MSIVEGGLTPRKIVERAQTDLRAFVDSQEGHDYTGVAILDYTQERIRKATYHAAVGFTKEMAEIVREIHVMKDWEDKGNV